MSRRTFRSKDVYLVVTLNKRGDLWAIRPYERIGSHIAPMGSSVAHFRRAKTPEHAATFFFRWIAMTSPTTALWRDSSGEPYFKDVTGGRL